jgi:signal transduction histidine kinase
VGDIAQSLKHTKDQRMILESGMNVANEIHSLIPKISTYTLTQDPNDSVQIEKSVKALAESLKILVEGVKQTDREYGFAQGQKGQKDTAMEKRAKERLEASVIEIQTAVQRLNEIAKKASTEADKEDHKAVINAAALESLALMVHTALPVMKMAAEAQEEIVKIMETGKGTQDAIERNPKIAEELISSADVMEKAVRGLLDEAEGGELHKEVVTGKIDSLNEATQKVVAAIRAGKKTGDKTGDLYGAAKALKHATEELLSRMKEVDELQQTSTENSLEMFMVDPFTQKEIDINTKIYDLEKKKEQKVTAKSKLEQKSKQREQAAWKDGENYTKK